MTICLFVFKVGKLGNFCQLKERIQGTVEMKVDRVRSFSNNPGGDGSVAVVEGSVLGGETNVFFVLHSLLRMTPCSFKAQLRAGVYGSKLFCILGALSTFLLSFL